MLIAKDFRKIARNSLPGKWAVSIGTGLVASLLGASITGIGIGNYLNGFNNDSTRENIQQWLHTDLGRAVLPWLIGLLIIINIWFILIFIIGGATTLGYTVFNIKLIERRDVRFLDLFTQFDRLGAGFCMQFLRIIYTLLWTLLLIIPGIIAGYRYAMTPYIMIEHPEYGANEAISYSKKLMFGNKWRLFCMHFSFIGWYLLCMLTFGIGSLWLRPYVEAANVAFYYEISGKEIMS